MKRLDEDSLMEEINLIIDKPMGTAYSLETFLKNNEKISLGKGTRGKICVGTLPDSSTSDKKEIWDKLEYVSREHCNIYGKKHKLYLEDISQNGTIIVRTIKKKHRGLGIKLLKLQETDNKTRFLEEGDEIYMGHPENIQYAYGPILYTEKPEGENVLFPTFEA